MEQDVRGTDAKSIEEVPQPSLERATSLDRRCGGQDKKAFGEIAVKRGARDGAPPNGFPIRRRELA
jgi:hypothetical protein